VGGAAWAQRAGGRGGGAPGGGGARGSAPPGADDKARAENAKQWAADIEKLRAQSPPPPLPQIKFPSQNEVLLGRLRWAEDPKHALMEYLDKLWKDAKDASAQRLAFEQFWRDAEKPKWARAATEDYYRKRANAALKPATPSKAPEPATSSSAPEAATSSKPSELGPAPEPATLPPSTSSHHSE
jgi:hypothetical protein